MEDREDKTTQLAELRALWGVSFVSLLLLCLSESQLLFLPDSIELMHACAWAFTRLCCHCLTFVSYISYKILVTILAIASQGLTGGKSE